MAAAQRPQSLEGHTDRVWGLAWSPQGDMLASCSSDKTIRIWSRTAARGEAREGWHCSAVLEDVHTRTIRSVCWSPSGRQLATGSFDATTTIWQVQGGVWEIVATLEGHENEVKSVAWSPDGSLLATCGRDKTVWIWESMPGHEFECVDVKQGHSQDVKMVAWHPGGEVLASASYDNTVKLWASDGDEWTCVQTLGGSQGGQGHASTVWGVAWEPPRAADPGGAGVRLASCSDDLTVRLWARQRSGSEAGASPRTSWGPLAAARWRCCATIQGYHSRPIYTLDWSRDGLLATGDGNDSIHIFAQQLGEAGAEAGGGGPGEDPGYGGGGRWALFGSIESAHSADVNCVRWHPAEPGLLASAGDDGLVQLWRWKRPTMSDGWWIAETSCAEALGEGR